MIREERLNGQTCPLCGNVYFEAPALSRADGKASICPDYGAREAFSSIGVPKEEQDKIIEIIHRYTKR